MSLLQASAPALVMAPVVRTGIGVTVWVRVKVGKHGAYVVRVKGEASRVRVKG